MGPATPTVNIRTQRQILAPARPACDGSGARFCALPLSATSLERRQVQRRQDGRAIDSEDAGSGSRNKVRLAG